MVDLDPVEDEDVAALKQLIQNHYRIYRQYGCQIYSG